MTALMECGFGALRLPSSAASSLAALVMHLCWRASASSLGAQPTHCPLSHAVHSRHRSGPPLRLARRLAKPLLFSWGGFALRAYWFGLHAPSSRRGKVVFAPPHAHPRLHSLLMDSLEPVDTESRSYLTRNTDVCVSAMWSRGSNTLYRLQPSSEAQRRALPGISERPRISGLSA